METPPPPPLHSPFAPTHHYFRPRANSIFRAILLGVFLLLSATAWAAWEITNSSYITHQHMEIDQPVQFSHEHHVAGLGLDCRFCHTSVTTSANAGIPPTKVCMSCHTQIWTNAALLQPVRDSWRDNKPIEWNRVHALPAYVFFNHSIHVNKGVGCSECHGRVDQMPLIQQAAPLTMSWCLDCHRNPADHLRPIGEVFNMPYQHPPNQRELGERLVKDYELRPTQALTDCTTCHR